MTEYVMTMHLAYTEYAGGAGFFPVVHDGLLLMPYRQGTFALVAKE